jgi:hypothetical protein
VSPERIRDKGAMMQVLAPLVAAALAVLLWSGVAHAQSAADTFADRNDGAKVHVSGFVCPERIGLFERDAVGEADPDNQADFCAYSALDGVYGAITLQPLNGGYDPKASFAEDFREQETTGGKRVGDQTVRIEGTSLSVFTRTYRTARAESLEYRILFSGAVVKNWIVETTIEYGDPRDVKEESQFLQTVYAAADKQIGPR